MVTPLTAIISRCADARTAVYRRLLTAALSVPRLPAERDADNAADAVGDAGRGEADDELARAGEDQRGAGEQRGPDADQHQGDAARREAGNGPGGGAGPEPRPPRNKRRKRTTPGAA